MEHICITTAPTAIGFCGTCDLLPAWIVTSEGGLDKFKVAVNESIDFYLECARKDNTPYPPIFDEKWELEFVFNLQAVLCYLKSMMTFDTLEHITGISQEQLADYAAGGSYPCAEQRKKIVEGLHSFGEMLSNIVVR